MVATEISFQNSLTIPYSREPFVIIRMVMYKHPIIAVQVAVLSVRPSTRRSTSEYLKFLHFSLTGAAQEQLVETNEIVVILLHNGLL